jgi:hypothetical protein
MFYAVAVLKLTGISHEPASIVDLAISQKGEGRHVSFCLGTAQHY